MANDSAAKVRKTASRKAASEPRGASKLGTLVQLLGGPTGATIDELAKATAWQKHSVRGALAGTLKKKGHEISSEVVDGVRRYRIATAQA